MTPQTHLFQAIFQLLVMSLARIATMSGAAAAVTKVAQANIVISIVGMVSELVRLGAKAVNTHIDNTRDAKEAINRRPEVAKLYATFTFQLGLNEVPLQTGEQPLQGAGGDLPEIRVWDETLTFLGDEANKDKTLQTGSIVDVEVHLSKPHQPTYALFKGKSDPICVTYIGTRWPNGAEWNWFGNWAYHCDRRWHVCPDPSKVLISLLTSVRQGTTRESKSMEGGT